MLRSIENVNMALVRKPRETVMDYKGYTTFNTEKKDGVLYVTFDYPPINVQEIQS